MSTARRAVRTARLAPSQWWALLGVLVLLLGALALRDQGSTSRAAGPAAQPPASADGGLDELRRQAGLSPCPAGLGPALPDLVLPCLGGGPDVALRAAPPGRPTVVNVWASWCGPCADEVPALVALAERAGERIGVVGVLSVDEPSRGLAFSRDFGIRYPSLVDDDGEVLRAFPPGPPVTLLLDADGRVVHTRSGAVRDLPELEGLVAEHLGVRL